MKRLFSVISVAGVITTLCYVSIINAQSSQIPSQPVATAPRTTVSAPVYIDAVASDAERRELEQLIQRAHMTLGSQQFRTNLLSLHSSYPSVYANENLPSITVSAVMDLLSLTTPGTREIRVPVALVGGEAFGGGPFNYTAYTGPIGAFPNQPSSLGSMSIGRVTMYRNRQWNPATKGDIVDHSCAINTMAHEMSHTISTSQTHYTFAFTDTAGRPDKTPPLASYLIGSVAQCTYLQIQGRIKAENVAVCVKIFGTHNFNNRRCPSFSGDRPVELRADLPAPDNPL